MKTFETQIATASDVASRTTYGGAGAGVLAAFLQVDWALSALVDSDNPNPHQFWLKLT